MRVRNRAACCSSERGIFPVEFRRQISQGFDPSTCIIRPPPFVGTPLVRVSDSTGLTNRMLELEASIFTPDKGFIINQVISDVCVHIYIYIYREREREVDMLMCRYRSLSTS